MATVEQASAEAAAQAPASSQAQAPASAEAQDLAAAAAAAAAAAPSTKMEVGENQAQQSQRQQSQTSRRSSSSSSPERKSGGQLRRTVRQLREDLEEVEAEQAALKRQLLWSMAQEVRRQRKEMSCQIVIQGWRPELEDASLWTAHQQRDNFCRDLFQRLTKLPHDRLQFETSHSTNLESLSRITVVTFSNAAITGAVLRASHQQRYGYGTASLQLRKQTSLYDRLCSAPAKIGMESLTSISPQLQGALRPDWRKGEVWSTMGALELLWEVNVEQACIRAYVDEPRVPEVAAQMEAGIKRLTFGWEGEAEAAGSGKGGGKGSKGGKGKKSSKSKHKATMPVASSCFKHEAAVVKDKLGSLHLAKYPFEIKVRALKEEQKAERGVPTQRRPASANEEQRPQRAHSQSIKRRSESREQANKRRSQSPRRYLQREDGLGDPWMRASQMHTQHAANPQAAAASSAAAVPPTLPTALPTMPTSSTAPPSMPQPDRQDGPVMFGQRIHA